MKKSLLLLLTVLYVAIGYSQTGKLWSVTEKSNTISVSKTAQRESFPSEFKLYNLNLDSFRQTLSSTSKTTAGRNGIIISIPNTDGNLEKFEMFESSNFDAALQAQFPEIRAYVGFGIDDKLAQVRLSAAPNGIQAMVFRTDKRNEFIEPYSADGSVYAVYNSSRVKGGLPFTCSTEDVQILNDSANKIMANPLSNTATLKTFKLALSCTGEYANYFGATTTAQVGLVLAAMNATMTRVNGVFEKDLAVHLNLIANEAAIIYYNATTDPYSDASTGSTGAWNGELQSNLTSTITDATYDIGHLFGASGGGGNAGCIGCVCIDGQKGSGFTSPSNGVPSGDSFDIDYVVHEMGHQFGGNHTFTHTSENNAVNVEPGSGSTIMGYAGITGSTDVQAHSDDYFAYASINQIQVNLVSKTCQVNTPITSPVFGVSAGSAYTIPKSTPFKLTGTRTDSGTNPLTYCWEENDDANASNVGATACFPSLTKTNGPNYRSFAPTAVPVRYFPAYSSVLSNVLTTTWETVSSVARAQTFALTARNNVVGGGQTQTSTMVVTTSGTVGPFSVSSQNTTETWQIGDTKTVTWNVNSANTLAGSANVDILLSTDGGLTFPYTLASGVVNNGTASVVVPSVTPSLTCRIMVKPTGNIYYALNTTNFYIGYSITNNCVTYNYTTPFSVPDNSTSYTVKSIVVPATTGTISDVNITVNATHPNIQNLHIAVVRPGGTMANLYNQGCASGANMNVTFDTQGGAMVCASPTAGSYQPSLATALSAMNGNTATGNWQLGFRDLAAGNTGTINSFSIEICTQTVALTNENFTFENFSLYPNPNHGSFNIKFNSNTNNDLKVAVYDISGREIFNKSYLNSGVFDQNLQLDSVQSGVYLVTVKDGDTKITKKIIIE